VTGAQTWDMFQPISLRPLRRRASNTEAAENSVISGIKIFDTEGTEG